MIVVGLANRMTAIPIPADFAVVRTSYALDTSLGDDRHGKNEA